MSEEEKEPHEDNESHFNFGKFFLVITIVAFLVGLFFVVRACVISTNEYFNNYDDSHLFRRDATINDMSIDSNLNVAALGADFVINPNVDIDDLEMTITFLDSNKDSLKSFVKFVGDVKEGVQVSFTISYLELGFPAVFEVTYVRGVVSGGTVSIFV